MSLPYPRNAQTIAESRRNGLRPAGPVIVVLHGQPQWDNALVYAHAIGKYRWDWVKGLPNVVVVIGKDTKFGSILDDIAECEPDQLDVVDAERELGWMVLFTRPRLQTVRWSKAAVVDWLGDQQWHVALNEEKARFGLETK